MTLSEVKKCQLDILDYVADFCENHGIRYWIDCGTLLGAIRHKGYIPWDDDIDIGMLREDYDKFTAAFHDANGKYQFVCHEKDKTFHLAFGKVLDLDTVLYEPDENGYKLSVNIDVFVYDNAPEDDRELKRMFDRRNRLHGVRVYKTYNPILDSRMEKAVWQIRRKIARIFFPGDPVSLLIDNAKRYEKCKTDRVGNFTASYRMSCSKRVFDSFVDVEFEGRKYKAPAGYDEWLRSFYGDYMQLPPVEKRIRTHDFVAYEKRRCGEEGA